MKYFIALLLSLSSLNAATLNVPGSYPTVQAAVTAAQPGDTVILAAGTYNEAITTARNGLVGSRITIDGGGVATVQKFALNHTYHTLQNLTVKGDISAYQQQIEVKPGASWLIIDNCTVDINRQYKRYGIGWTGSNGAPKANDCIIQNSRVIQGWAYPMVELDGERTIFRNNTVQDGWDVDLMRLFGDGVHIHDNTFADNTVTPPANLPPPFGGDTVENHPDFIQTLGNNGETSQNHIIERNLISNALNSGLAQMDANGQSTIRNWLFRNNIFSNIGQTASIGFPGVRFYNNVFYRCNVSNKGHALTFGGALYYGSNLIPDNHPITIAGLRDNPTPSGSLALITDPGEQYGAGYVVVTEKIPDGTPLVAGRVYKVRARGTGKITYNGTDYTNAQSFTAVSGVTSWTRSATVPGDLGSVWLKHNAQVTYNGTNYGEVGYFQTTGGIRTYTANYPDAVFVYRCLRDISTGGEAINNAFLACGDPVNNTNGWYVFNGEYDDIAADHNYVAKAGFVAMRPKSSPIAVGQPGGANKYWYEPNGINGGDPGFADFSTNDFRLQPSSILIDQGTDLADVTTDYLLNERPRGTSSDIGAYEYAGSGQVVNEYYVSTTGSDSNAGTAAAPFLTIQFAVTTAPAGKPIYVAPGTYNERVTTARNGNSASRVRIIANGGTVTMKGFVVNHSYVTIDGFTITGHSGASNADGHVKVGSGGDFMELKNCTVAGNRHLVRSNYVFTAGTNTISTATGGFSGIVAVGNTIFVEKTGSSVTFSGNNGTVHTVTAASDTSITVSTALTTQGPIQAYITASYQYGVAFDTGATDCLVQACTFQNLSFDAMYLVGSRHIVEDCTFTAIGGWDVIHFGGADHIVRDNTFKDSPYIAYSPSADVWENLSAVNYSNILFSGNFISNFAGVIAVQKGSATSTGLQIKNNIFVDVGLIALTHPNTSIQNNTFVRVSRNQSAVVARSDRAIYVNEASAATGVTVQNNVFYDCGESASANQTLVGWYEVVGSSSFTALKNFASGITPGFAAKVGWPEPTPALNGGDPGFVNIASPLGTDGIAFTADDGLRLATGSKLIGAGVSGADIGAYGVVTDLPPTVPSALSGLAIGSSGVALSWSDDSDNESGFELARSEDEIAWVITDILAANAEQWVVNGLLPSTTYYWRLRSYNSFGQSEWSTSDATTTAAAPPVKSRNPRTNQGIPQ